MAKKHPSHEEHADESWLIPYADLLTLLLALFIVLFASSNASEEKMAAMSDAFSSEYTFLGQGDNIGSEGMLPGQDNLLIAPDANEGEGGMETGDSDAPQTAEEAAAEAAAAMQGMVNELQNTFSTYVEHNFLQDQMEINGEPEGLLVTLTSDVWFDSGSAAINDSQREIAVQVAEMISEFQEKSGADVSVVVSGHTDSVPMSAGSRYEDNAELSVFRAYNFMRVLNDNSSLDISKFSVRGFGDSVPIDTNDTPEGRQRNRRVEVFISPEILSAPTGTEVTTDDTAADITATDVTGTDDTATGVTP